MLTSRSFHGDNSRSDLDLNIVWDLQLLIREDVPHAGRLWVILEDSRERMSTTAICVCGSDFLKVVGELARNSDRPIMFETVLALHGGYRATELVSSFMNTSKCSNSPSLSFQLTAKALFLAELPSVDYVLPRQCSQKLSMISFSLASQCKMYSFPKYLLCMVCKRSSFPGEVKNRYSSIGKFELCLRFRTVQQAT
jgi:hypothetical protein